MTNEMVAGAATSLGEQAAPRGRDCQPMYGSLYGLAEPPFDLTPDPKFLFLTPRQREALGNLHYGLSTSRGFTLLLGEAGTGKTTMVRAVLAGLGDSLSRYVLISNPTLERTEFYELLTRGFGLSSSAQQSKAAFLAELQDNVESRFAAGGLTGIIIDEAQSLPAPLLEEIRLLGNIETTKTKLLNIVLAGQPEFADRLNEPGLRQLKQRVTLRCQLGALTADETAAYIAGRIRIAGGVPEEIFSRSAIGAIQRGSRGIPRLINVLCDNALINGFATATKPIGADIIEDVCRDFDLTVTEPAAAAAVSSVAPNSGHVPAPGEQGTAKNETPAPAPPYTQQSGGAMPERDLFAGTTKPKPRFGFFSELFGR